MGGVEKGFTHPWVFGRIVHLTDLDVVEKAPPPTYTLRHINLRRYIEPAVREHFLQQFSNSRPTMQQAVCGGSSFRSCQINSNARLPDFRDLP